MSSFDAMSHEWLVKFIEHRIADKRVIRHVKKWLKAGVLEDGRLKATREGSPQGGSVSPLLANIYLHYALDLWVENWRRRHAGGEITIVRYADDFIIGFQSKTDAERFQFELEERLREFNLELHPEKTRLLEFGRHAANDRSRRGGGKPGTFDFLGFTHICGKTKRGRFVVVRRSSGKRVRRKLVDLKRQIRRRAHEPIPEQGKWLRRVTEGWFRYHAVPRNFEALARFRGAVMGLWLRALQRRSQRGRRLKWERFVKIAERWLPKPRILHPYPEQRLRVMTQGRSPVR